tara:strand:+ start:149 stop:862 length:714 start_codon:yes stop_codon:yes gene_type:complete
MEKKFYLTLIREALDKGDLTQDDLRNLLSPYEDKETPENLTETFYNWYLNLGIESLTKNKFNLTKCPFTSEEIKKAYLNNEFIIVIPKNITSKQLLTLFNLNCIHDLDDKLIQYKVEIEDTWIKVSALDIPEHLDRTCIEINRIYEDEEKSTMNLPKYIVFMAWFFKINNKYPDVNYWNYLIASKYDRSGVLIAGYDDRNNALNVHGWKKNHPRETWLGSRYVKHCKRIEVRDETKF